MFVSQEKERNRVVCAATHRLKGDSFICFSMGRCFCLNVDRKEPVERKIEDTGIKNICWVKWMVFSVKRNEADSPEISLLPATQDRPLKFKKGNSYFNIKYKNNVITKTIKVNIVWFVAPHHSPTQGITIDLGIFEILSFKNFESEMKAEC